MNRTLKQCDDYVGQLLQIIDQNEFLRTNLNVIITSDHGMHEIDKTHKIVLEQFVDKTLFRAYGGRSFVNIFVNRSKAMHVPFARSLSLPKDRTSIVSSPIYP